MGYAWSPDGDRLTYQAGTFEDSALRVVDLSLDRDTVFVDEPDSEQAIVTLEDIGCAWSTEGLVFTTNHETGYRELAIADGDGEYELRYVNHHDKAPRSGPRTAISYFTKSAAVTDRSDASLTATCLSSNRRG